MLEVEENSEGSYNRGYSEIFGKGMMQINYIRRQIIILIKV